MNLTTLKALSWAVLKIVNRLEEAGKTDPVLAALYEEGFEWRQKIRAVEQTRELVAAEKADAGRILWTVFIPDTTGCGRRASVTRTSKRMIREWRWNRGETRRIVWVHSGSAVDSAEAFHQCMLGNW